MSLIESGSRRPSGCSSPMEPFGCFSLKILICVRTFVLFVISRMRKCGMSLAKSVFSIKCKQKQWFSMLFPRLCTFFPVCFAFFIRKLDFMITHWPPQTLRPESIFVLVPPPPDPGCKEDRECASKEACFDRECKNPCLAIKPCARNAKCEVHSSLPLRTMSCTCIPGYTGKGDVRCDKISKTLV